MINIYKFTSLFSNVIPRTVLDGFILGIGAKVIYISGSRYMVSWWYKENEKSVGLSYNLTLSSSWVLLI